MMTPNTSLDMRHDDAIALAKKWMKETGLSQAKLANLCDTSHDYVCRFLKKHPLYSPQPSRETAIALLESIEYICRQYHAVTGPNDPDYAEYTKTDTGKWFIDFQNAIKRIMKSPAPQGLAELGSYCEQAINGPSDLYIRMIANAGAAIGSRLDIESIDISLELLRDTFKRCQRLMGELQTPSPDEYYGLGINFITYSSFHAARRILRLEADEEMAASRLESLDTMLSHVGEYRQNKDGAWTDIFENTVRALECNFQDETDDAQLWADRLVQECRGAVRPVAWKALENVTTPQLTTYLRYNHPDFFKRDDCWSIATAVVAVLGGLTLFASLSGRGSNVVTVDRVNEVKKNVAVSGKLVSENPVVSGSLKTGQVAISGKLPEKSPISGKLKKDQVEFRGDSGTGNWAISGKLGSITKAS